MPLCETCVTFYHKDDATKHKCKKSNVINAGQEVEFTRSVSSGGKEDFV